LKVWECFDVRFHSFHPAVASVRLFVDEGSTYFYRKTRDHVHRINTAACG